MRSRKAAIPSASSTSESTARAGRRCRRLKKLGPGVVSRRSSRSVRMHVPRAVRLAGRLSCPATASQRAVIPERGKFVHEGLSSQRLRGPREGLACTFPQTGRKVMRSSRKCLTACHVRPRSCVTGGAPTPDGERGRRTGLWKTPTTSASDGDSKGGSPPSSSLTSVYGGLKNRCFGGLARSVGVPAPRDGYVMVLRHCFETALADRQILENSI